ncbi:IclR family transcriptional regulator [Cucumibacter marinus]|uniref:IclR family transcriptional regulator n=1 Tax=Cucumibacter marinus TaxID=1121252 RepID=UPI000407BB86|nr:IclR family transcriptional regulator [Cucumibacter marinus]
MSTIKSLGKALRALETIADHQPIGVTQLATLLEQPKSSVQRILKSLEEIGWIQPSADEQTRWELTYRASRLAQKAGSHFGLRETVLPHMESLRRATGETVHLAVRDGNEMILIERIESNHAIRHVEALGGRASVLVTATGKALLAQLSPAEQAEIHASASVKLLDDFPGIQVPDLAALQTELREIAARGYATTTSWREGVYATGAAILDKHGRAVASISISTPESRMTDEKKKEHAQLLIEHCAQIRENGLGAH